MRLTKLVIVAMTACFEPTEITLDITTNVDCQTGIREVDIYISGKGDPTPTAPSAVAYNCVDPASDHVGSLVVVPSNRGETVNIAVVAVLVGATSCTPDSTDTHCIVSRRSLDYITHTPLELPVFLDSSCAGFACPDTQTCVADHGVPQCVDDQPACGSANTCGLDAGASVDASRDVIASDVIDVLDAGTCPSPTLGIFAQKPKYAWSFEGTLAENNASFPTPQSNNTTMFLSGGATSCGQYANPNGNQQLLTPTAAGFSINHFAIAAWLKGPSSTASNATILRVGTGTLNVQLSVVSGVVTSQLCDNVSCHTVADADALIAGSWSTAVIEVQQQPGLVSLYRNGKSVASVQVTLTGYIAPDGPLMIGPAAGVDQVEFYPLP